MEAKETTRVLRPPKPFGDAQTQEYPFSGWRSAPYVYTGSCFLSLAAVLITSWILTVFIFPFYDSVLTEAREISMAFNALTLITIAVVATWRPQSFQSNVLIPGTAVCLAVGIIVTALGLAEPSISMLVIGASMTAIARGIITALVGLSFLRMPLRRAGVIVAAACLLAYFSRSLFLLVAPEAALSTFILTPLFALFLTYPYARQALKRIASTKAPANLSVTQPTAYLSFGHKVFLCLFMLRIAYGFALTLGESEGVPLSTTYALIPLLLLFLAVLFYRKPLNSDTLLWTAFVLVVSGFLFLAGQEGSNLATVNTFLMAGAGCIDVLSWFVLIALASKNISGSLSVLAWGLAVSAVGSLIGSSVGAVTAASFGTDPAAVSSIAMTAALLYVVFAALVLHNFSLKATIAGVDQEKPPVTHKGSVFLAERCAALEAQYHLNEAESEVFEQLALGKDRRLIQTDLSMRGYSVKANVRQVYRKLGIQTQQELIDMVESAEPQQTKALMRVVPLSA